MKILRASKGVGRSRGPAASGAMVLFKEMGMTTRALWADAGTWDSGAFPGAVPKPFPAGFPVGMGFIVAFLRGWSLIHDFEQGDANVPRGGKTILQRGGA